MRKERKEQIKAAYHTLGRNGTFYDGMITCSTISGKAVCKLVWDMDQETNDRYLALALSKIPENFSGRLLEVPVGTGILTMPLYQTLPRARITCVDYSEDMLGRARQRAKQMRLKNVRFTQGDVGQLPFEDKSFDIVLSLNGFHAFPDKEAAFSETFRVLKSGGLFCGAFYISGEGKRTDWFLQNIYVKTGYFTPPFDTRISLESRLQKLYEKVSVQAVQSEGVFHCRKANQCTCNAIYQHTLVC